MTEKVWTVVRRSLGHGPIVDGDIGGSAPLHVERYLYQTIERSVLGLDLTCLVTQFGGARVHEGETGHLRSMNLPTQSLLIPAGVPTHWHYEGTVDFAVFYLLDGDSAMMNGLKRLASAFVTPMHFSDQLVGASALQLLNEIQKGSQADEGFMERLSCVMLEQCYRVLTTPGTGGINPRHVHFSRLQVTLNFIHENLTDDLSATTLAKRANLSLAHFRRIFEEAIGMAPHRYIMHVRLEQARKLLSASPLPISRIAQECGFSSQSHLTACFRGAHAVTPADFRASMGASNRR
ncbi:MAG: helix-turn-helix transcriptional regulator [Rhodocyclaceae bacterium]|nr:helix-turn-helix transcriptional regulator [Rhodocyclaceae bacterium]